MSSVCAVVGCPNLKPCPTHSRPTNAHWSKDRDRATQHRQRIAALTRDGYTCRRCGLHDPTGRELQAHHVTPTETQTLCRACHRTIDKHAR